MTDPNLALTANPIPPSDVEKQARAVTERLMSQHHSEDAIAKRLAVIEASRLPNDEDTIQEKAKRLAKVIIASKERAKETE